MSSLPITLTGAEIKEITGYVKAAKQLQVLEKLKIPALKRPDNTVMVLRRDCIYPVGQVPANEPKLKLSKK